MCSRYFNATFGLPIGYGDERQVAQSCCIPHTLPVNSFEQSDVLLETFEAVGRRGAELPAATDGGILLQGNLSAQRAIGSLCRRRS
jgi:hypothetical protein